jgi:putative FmdB family regulatory protein
MPTYEFVCADCGGRSEVRATVREKQAGLRHVCGACGGDRLRQAFSAVAVLSRRPAAVQAPGGCCGAGGCACTPT